MAIGGSPASYRLLQYTQHGLQICEIKANREGIRLASKLLFDLMFRSFHAFLLF